MTQTNVLVPTANVIGDVTACKIENQLISTERVSATSLQEVNTYVSYDVCSKQIIYQYQVPDITFFGGMAILAGVVGIIIVTAVVIGLVLDA